MSVQVRWVVGVVAAILVVCLVIWARGHAHHEGIQVDDKAAPVPVLVLEQGGAHVGTAA
jgi:hypothetical protein